MTLLLSYGGPSLTGVNLGLIMSIRCFFGFRSDGGREDVFLSILLVRDGFSTALLSN